MKRFEIGKGVVVSSIGNVRLPQLLETYQSVGQAIAFGI
ncbi:hypothetical protein JOC95_000062 [Bacillus tianshenii]|uniref:Uncharacterized protein n=1 Tax=Sutcliffiella tianshenii TaxID=1463404 RepID=A0ABS2NU88_9BACI|nr:hypothetical protein [Bacillus tianshenii]